MHRDYNNGCFNQQCYRGNEDRFIGPLLPFLGGAAIGYIAGRPQYNYPNYYPVYYPYYQPIYNQPYSIPIYSNNTYYTN